MEHADVECDGEAATGGVARNATRRTREPATSAIRRLSCASNATSRGSRATDVAGLPSVESNVEPLPATFVMAPSVIPPATRHTNTESLTKRLPAASNAMPHE